MKLTKGKNWWQFNLTKNKAIYYGPKLHSDKENDIKSNNVSLRIGTRRVKFIIDYDKVEKQWSIHFGGCFRKNFPKNLHIDYNILVWDPENKTYSL